MQNLPFPPIDRALLTELDRRFPERSPDPDHSEREIWMLAGERRLVRFLHAQLAAQEKGSLLKQ